MANTIRNALVAMLGAAAVLFGMSGMTEGGIVAIQSYTTTSSIGKSTLTVKNIAGASEGLDYMYDSLFLSSPYTNALETYSMVEGNKLSTDAHPIETLGWDFYLGVKGSVSGIDNSLKFKPTDTSDLTDKLLSAYDYAHPQTVYAIDNTLNVITTITLPKLTGANGEYAHWRLDLAPTPEPSTIALLSVGVFGLGAWGWRNGNGRFGYCPPGARRSKIMATAMGLITLVFVAAAVIATDAWGGPESYGDLELRNVVQGGSDSSNAQVELMRYDDPNISDGYDPLWDFTWGFPGPPGGGSWSAMYSDLSKIGQGNYHLDADYRLTSSTTPYYVELLFAGTVRQSEPNTLSLSFPYASDGFTFGADAIYIQEVNSSGSRIGPKYDVRDIINNDGGLLSIGSLPAGTYNQNTPYRQFAVDITPTPEPSPLALLGVGAAGLVAYAWRRKRRVA